MENLFLGGGLGGRLLSRDMSIVGVRVCRSGCGFWSRGDGSLRNSSLSELSLDPSNSLFELGRLQRNTKIVTVILLGTLTLGQRVRSALGAFASKLPAPRKLLTSPPPSLDDGFAGALSNVHVSHREFVAFLEVAEGDQGEFGCPGFVE